MRESLEDMVAGVVEESKQDKEGVFDALAPFVKEQMELAVQIEEQNIKLANLTERYRFLSVNKIPEILGEYGIESGSLKLKDGHVLEIKEVISATITKANQAAAYTWLRDNGFGDIIKREVAVAFGKGQDEDAETLLRALAMQGLPVTDKEGVHASTLKSFIREQLKNNDIEVPEALFSVYRGLEAKIK